MMQQSKPQQNYLKTFLKCTLVSVSMIFFNHWCLAKEVDQKEVYATKIAVSDFTQMSKFCMDNKFINSLNKDSKNKIDSNTCLKALNNEKLFYAFIINTKNTFTEDQLKIMSTMIMAPSQELKHDDIVAISDLSKKYNEKEMKKMIEEIMIKNDKLKLQKMLAFEQMLDGKLPV